MGDLYKSLRYDRVSVSWEYARPELLFTIETFYGNMYKKHFFFSDNKTAVGETAFIKNLITGTKGYGTYLAIGDFCV